MTHNGEEPLRFEIDIKPMFRERDRRSMEFAFDLSGRTTTSANLPTASSPAS